MRTIAEWIRDAERRLAAATETPRLDAELILAHAMGISRASLLARLRDPLPELAAAESMLERRERGEPLAYLFGNWEFFSLKFEVTPPALVPRPETEHLVEAVLGFIGGRPASVLDLCTGTGCVAVSVAVNAPQTRLVAVDIHPAYATLAQLNAGRHSVSDRVECRVGDLFGPLKHRETFDAICANPPYIEAKSWDSLSPTIRNFEDPRALLAGDDGLDLVRRIIHEAAAHLRAGGLLALEIGLGQSEAARGLMQAAGYRDVHFARDLAGIERVALGTSAPALERSGRDGQENWRAGCL